MWDKDRERKKNIWEMFTIKKKKLNNLIICVEELEIVSVIKPLLVIKKHKAST